MRFSAAIARPPASPDVFDFAVRSACDRFVNMVREGGNVSAAAGALVGLGRGLTPAGDDFLGGFLFVRHRRGHRERVDATGTHIISRTRLAMHEQGLGTRAETRFVDTLLAGRDASRAASLLRRFGHSSGDDFIRGATAAKALA